MGSYKVQRKLYIIAFIYNHFKMLYFIFMVAYIFRQLNWT